MKQTLRRLNPRLIVYSTIFSPKELFEKYINKGWLKEMGFLHALSINALASLRPTLGGLGATVFYGELIPRLGPIPIKRLSWLQQRSNSLSSILTLLLLSLSAWILIR